MKIHLNQYKLALAVVISLFTYNFALAFKNDDGIEKIKKYSKIQSLNGEKVFIKNSFGSVKINHWQQNEVKVEVTIIAKSKTENEAQKQLDNISISNIISNNIISFITINKNNGNSNNVLKNTSKNNADEEDDESADVDKNDGKTNVKTSSNSKNNTTTTTTTKTNFLGKTTTKTTYSNNNFEINYEVFLPDNTALEIVNEFGSTSVPSRDGETELTSKFGSLSIGDLTNVKSILVEFGNLIAENIIAKKVTIKFSGATIKEIRGSQIKCNFEFCGNVNLGLSNQLSEIIINNSYSTMVISLPNNFNASYNVHTSFGEFKNSSVASIKYNNDDDDNNTKFDKDYTGITGNGNCKVKINSSFGKIKLVNSK